MATVKVPPARSRFGVSGIVRTLALAAGGAAAVGLLLFHARLLWLRASGGSILDTPVALRWGLSTLLLGAVFALRRPALSRTNSRNALVFWLLVALLHWSAGTPEARLVVANREVAVETLFLLPAATAAVAVGAGLWLLFVGRFRPAPRLALPSALPFDAAPALRAGWGQILAARPPPA